MSVLLDLSVFPTDQGASVSGFVAPVIAMIRESGHPYRLSAMGTIVETDDLGDALGLIARAYQILDAMGCERVYAITKLDIRKGAAGRLTGKVDSVRRLVGEVDT